MLFCKNAVQNYCFFFTWQNFFATFALKKWKEDKR